MALVVELRQDPVIAALQALVEHRVGGDGTVDGSPGWQAGASAPIAATYDLADAYTAMADHGIKHTSKLAIRLP